MVCLYGPDGKLVGTYQDVTDNWQFFDRVRTSKAFNGFQDNAVYFLHATGVTSCEQPQRYASVDHAGYGPGWTEDSPGRQLLPGRAHPVDVASTSTRSEGVPGQGSAKRSDPVVVATL